MTIAPLTLTRDEWLVVNRALQDRVVVLLEKGSGRPLVGKEISECERLEKVTLNYLHATWINPKGGAA
jgi:hypothetical protein